MSALLVYVLAYLLGAVPFGVLVARAKGVDIMAVGSGNIGTTNVGRTLGRTAGIVVFILDTGKGAVGALVAQQILAHGELGLLPIDHAAIAGTLGVLGHLFSPFLGFRGGKGVATGLGAALAVSPLAGLLSFAVFGVVLLVTRYVSLSSLIGVSSVFFWAWVTHQRPSFFGAFVFVLAGIWFKHLENIERLRRGTERKVSFSKKSGGEGSPPTENGDGHAG